MSRDALVLPLPGPDVLAMGAWFESRPGRVISGRFYAAPVVGDLVDADACRRFDAALAQLCACEGATPLLVAHDLHPDFHSSQAGFAWAGRLGVAALGVQHHHAHIAAVLAEHGWRGPALGIAADGVGLGSDGSAWGGELLRVDGPRFTRLGHLKPLPMPGGDRAAREPWRLAAAVLHMLGRQAGIAERFGHHTAAARLSTVMASARLCPPSTSLGRYFDAAAALLGLCELNTTPAEAPMALERAAQAYGLHAPLPGLWRVGGDLELDLMPLFEHLADEHDAGRGAALFHACVAGALVDGLKASSAWSDASAVVLGGGCFHNNVLRTYITQALERSGKTVLAPRRFSPGDAAIALGQAWVAQRTLEEC